MSRKKILVVDDEPGFTRLLKLALPQYEIREENDSPRALAAAREFRPDLILLDFIMPSLDGGDLAEQISADAHLQHIPIIFLTAIVAPGQAGGTERDLGGYPFLTKPISATALAACIEEHLGAP